MPKLPGRTSNRRTFKIDDLVIESFLSDHEEKWWRRRCIVEGCEHRLGPDTTNPRCSLEYESCGEHGPAIAVVVPEGALNQPWPEAGPVCPCHVDEILAG